MMQERHNIADDSVLLLDIKLAPSNSRTVKPGITLFDEGNPWFRFACSKGGTPLEHLWNTQFAEQSIVCYTCYAPPPGRSRKLIRNIPLKHTIHGWIAMYERIRNIQ